NEITAVAEANSGEQGALENLGFDGAQVSTDVRDTIDITTATLTNVGSGNEDSGSVTYTVNLDHAPQADQSFTLSLSNGQTETITVLANETSASLPLSWGNAAVAGDTPLDGYPDSDVYKEADFNLAVTDFVKDGDGGNFEDLQVADNSIAVVISDTSDVTGLSLTAATDLTGAG